MNNEDYDLPPDPFASTPIEMREWCYNEIKEHVTYYDVEYPDNFRYADIGEPDQLEAYEEIRLGGC